MDRKKFIRRGILGALGAGLAAKAASQTSPELTPEKSLVGFNHLPEKEFKTMKTVFHPADSRGEANHGWLHSRHSFSFARYHNPERMNFGTLRVLNDDVVAPARGFGKHPHDNMEIVSIPLEGALRHQDSMGNTFTIAKDDVQIMSAGTGIFHSEQNDSTKEEVKFLQIWVLPKRHNIEPRYDQLTYRPSERVNQWQTVVSPEDDGSVWINQDAWFSLTRLEAGKALPYRLAQNGNGMYIFVLDGEVEVEGQQLGARDGFGIWDTEAITVKGLTESEVLLMDIPMQSL